MTNTTNTERLTDDRINDIGRQVFEQYNGRPHPWDGLQSWVVALVRAALAEAKPGPVSTRLVKALKFYADKDHLMIADPDAWDTVSGEPENYLCDDAGTATVEDGSVARAALAEAEGQAVPQATDLMVDAYLVANTAYWQEVDALPTNFTKPWRNGTPREATRLGLQAAMLAAAPEAPAAPTVAEPVAYVELTDAECDEFRRHSGDFNSMLRATHRAGHLRGVVSPPAPREPLTVDAAIGLLVDALAASKGWLRGYAESIIRDAIDCRGAPRERLTEVWVVGNRTATMAFATEDLARNAVAGASPAVGLVVTRMTVIGTDREGG